MGRPSDQEYKITRLIKLGKNMMDEKFNGFAEWIHQKYLVQILNIYTDTLDNGTLRLQLIFEHETDLSIFFLKDRFTSSKRMVNAIEKKYKETFQLAYLKPILVLFYAFEPLAKEEANTKISLKTITSIEEKYKNVLWKIARFGEHVTFFLNTNVQLKKAKQSGLTVQLKQEYLEVLKHYDEFNYFTLSNFNAVFDSKENFDKNYNGNWRAYYN